MPTLTIDGQSIEVPSGTNLIEASRQIGVDVPHYCYHPALSIAASCRMCQVELHQEGAPPRVVVACQTEAADGMTVSTDGADCKQARAATLEFLLANHPLDCPICDKAGECDLQNFSYWHGNAQGRFREPKREAIKRTSIGDHILLDQERCILCTRCTRFMDEYAKAPQLVVAGRGDRNVITTFPGEKISSNYEGNLADICPVGALTLEEFRFKSRVWDLTHQDSVCPSCDRGCSIRLETKRNRLLRVRPRENPNVNGHFMCDIGRFGLLESCNPEHRVSSLRQLDDSSNAPNAVDLARELLVTHAGKWLILASSRMTLEEAVVVRDAFAPHLAPDGLVFISAAEQPGDDILYTGKQAANESGLRLAGYRECTLGEVRERVAAAPDTALWSFDGDVAGQVLVQNRTRFAAIMDCWNSSHGQEHPDARPHDVDLFLPALLFSEKNGTWVNRDGVLQRLRAAQRAPVGTLSIAELFAAILDRPASSPGCPDRTHHSLGTLGLNRLPLSQIPATGIPIDSLRAEVAAS